MDEFLKKHGYPRTVKSVVIKRGAVISVGCIIIAGVTIGENAIVGAGSVVTKDISESGIYAGNPAKKIAINNRAGALFQREAALAQPTKKRNAKSQFKVIPKKKGAIILRV